VRGGLNAGDPVALALPQKGMLDEQQQKMNEREPAPTETKKDPATKAKNLAKR